MSRVVVTGITGTLGSALGQTYLARGWEVVGASRSALDAHPSCTRVCRNAQADVEDARALLAEEPDVVVLNAGQIESEVGEHGLPLVEQTVSIHRINALFPSLFALEAAAKPRERRLDVVAVGSIADGAPSAFGPVYHASKIALHYFYTGVGPIVRSANPNLRLRLYRPGAIRGPLSWAPAIRLNQRATRIRKKRCDAAPEAERVAEALADWIEGDAWVGTYEEPLSFRALRLLFALAPDLYYRLQLWAWRKGSRFA